MVMQAMTSNVEALLSFFAKKSQRFEQVCLPLTVIPAKAGIQLNMRPKDTTFFVLSAAHNIFVLGSGLRRNDARFDVALRSAT
jgi:hypothetical protein